MAHSNHLLGVDLDREDTEAAFPVGTVCVGSDGLYVYSGSGPFTWEKSTVSPDEAEPPA